MKNLVLLRGVSLFAGLAIFAGCQTREIAVINQSASVVEHRNNSDSHEYGPQSLKYYTKVAKRRIVIDIVDRTPNGDYDSILKSLAGSIANSGFEVGSDNAYLVVSLNNSVSRIDGLGNFYIYKGMSEITVNRNRFELFKDLLGQNTLIARRTIKANGDRKLGKGEAFANLAEKLGNSASEWVATVCQRELDGLQAEKIDFDMAIFNEAFKGFNKGKGINLFLEKIAHKPGVLSCVQLPYYSSEKLSIECVYRKKEYPHGLVHQEDLLIHGFSSYTLKGRVDELTAYLLK